MILTIARYLIPALMGAAAAWTIQGWRLDAAASRHAAELAELRAAAEAERAAAEAEARTRLEAAQKKAAAAVQRQSRLEVRLKEEQARAKAALHAIPDRPCLGSEHLGLLAQSPGLTISPVPQAPGGTARAAAGPSPHPGPEAEDLTSTERAISGWMMDAAALYETCRSRIHAIRQWAEQSD
jgi:hypothetical protein